MKLKSAVVLACLTVVTAYATGVSREWIPSISDHHILKLSNTGRAYEVSGIGISQITKAAIINQKVVSQGMEIDNGLILNNVEMDSFSISAANVEVSLTL